MECTIYKKGKGHRVLVCPSCGVLATNPISFKKVLGAGLSMVPAGNLINLGLEATGLMDEKKAQSPQSFPRESYSTEEKVRDALAR